MDSGNVSEGSSLNRPPSFSGENYGYWKERMRIFIESIGIEIWDAIENGPYVPMKVDGEKQVEKHQGMSGVKMIKRELNQTL